MPLIFGTRLGSYEIKGSLGAGGMGEVYRARDTKLHRDVAIKVLPDVFAADPDRLARFEREASHPCGPEPSQHRPIYGLEGSALVMELVDGEDLRRASPAGRFRWTRCSPSPARSPRRSKLPTITASSTAI